MIRGTALTVALLALLTAAPAGPAAAAAEPSLTVTVSDGVEEASPGDILEYVAAVENSGGTPFEGILTITPPPFLELESADAKAEGGALSWEVSLGPGERFEATATGEVGADTGDAYQVVVLASVAAADAPAEVLVRAADSDRIAGTEAPPAVPGMEEPAVPVNWLPWVAIGGVLVLIAAGLVVAVRLRRRG